MNAPRPYEGYGGGGIRSRHGYSNFHSDGQNGFDSWVGYAVYCLTLNSDENTQHTVLDR
jgi:hypothetical protein